MPQEGIQFLPKPHLLSYEEMLRVCTIFGELGISKIRITGGEPFVRKDILPFIRKISEIEQINKINLTTNGVLTAPFVPELKQLGIHSVNLSLDTLNKNKFHEITRRDEFDLVWKTFESLLAHEIPVKINMVVMANKNIEDILPMVALTKDIDVAVRFIEEMPFNGEGRRNDESSQWHFPKILSYIQSVYPDIEKMADEANSTSYNYKIPGFKGSVGIIAAYSRTFCGTCNRIRLTPTGGFRTCLYGDEVLNIRDLMRAGTDNEAIKDQIISVISKRAKNGFEAELNRSGQINESMTTIGG
jgi:cyclic pyranopterin phosphate synthase